MKLYLFFLGALLMIGCSKTDKPSGPHNPNGQPPMVFQIHGLADTTVEQIDTLEFPITVTYQSGYAVPISLGVMHIPDSITVFVDPQVDTPTYTAKVRIITYGASLGTHVIQLRASGVNINKDFYFQLNVVPNPTNPATALIGNYEESGNCSGSGSVAHNATVSVIPTTFNRIAINSIWKPGGNYNVYADINPSNGTLTIPSQSAGGMTFSGSGTYTANEIQINYHVTDGNLVNDYCGTTLTR